MTFALYDSCYFVLFVPCRVQKRRMVSWLKLKHGFSILQKNFTDNFEKSFIDYSHENLFLKILKYKKNIRCEQDSNLRGKIPMDFESIALTARPSQHVRKTENYAIRKLRRQTAVLSFLTQKIRKNSMTIIKEMIKKTVKITVESTWPADSQQRWQCRTGFTHVDIATRQCSTRHFDSVMLTECTRVLHSRACFSFLAIVHVAKCDPSFIFACVQHWSSESVRQGFLGEEKMGQIYRSAIAVCYLFATRIAMREPIHGRRRLIGASTTISHKISVSCQKNVECNCCRSFTQ